MARGRNGKDWKGAKRVGNGINSLGEVKFLEGAQLEWENKSKGKGA